MRVSSQFAPLILHHASRRRQCEGLLNLPNVASCVRGPALEAICFGDLLSVWSPTGFVFTPPRTSLDQACRGVAYHTLQNKSYIKGQGLAGDERARKWPNLTYIARPGVGASQNIQCTARAQCPYHADVLRSHRGIQPWERAISMGTRETDNQPEKPSRHQTIES